MSAAICLALAIWFEAGIEPPDGQIAVGWSVVNSAATLHHRPHKICSEVYSGRYIAINNMEEMPHGTRWKQTTMLAKEILARKIPDPTDGAQFFECTKWKSCKSPPWWAAKMKNMGMHGTQVFYKEVSCRTIQRKESSTLNTPYKDFSPIQKTQEDSITTTWQSNLSSMPTQCLKRKFLLHWKVQTYSPILPLL